MARLKLSSPWVTYYHEMCAFFKEDKEVHVLYDEDENLIQLFVDSDTKAQALAKILPTEKIFGNVTLHIEVVPPNGCRATTIEDNVSIYRYAFKGNPAFDTIEIVRGVFAHDVIYILFDRSVVQYWNDNLADYNGVCSTLYQNIARNIFVENEGVYFCTSLESKEADFPF